jgi:hypothetical protein
MRIIEVRLELFHGFVLGRGVGGGEREEKHV